MKYNAIIIAAGTSSRFVPISYEKPKGLIEVKGEVLIERQIRQLHEGGIKDITIVVGYMANSFAYLKKKYDVTIVNNEDYMCYNNTSSLMRVLSKLNNTYICCSDQYYEHNPFITKYQESSYAALYANGQTNEYCLDINDAGQIQNVFIGGENSWYMAGFAFFSNDFSEKFKKILMNEYNLLSTRTSYWEDIYIKHIGTLPLMRPIMFKQNELLEFDSIDELRQYDTSYINNTRSKYIVEICKKINCKEQELTCFKRNNQMKGKVFVFKYKNRNFIYNNGEINIC
jgi:CTP:phosphocholine cytidylyltransferase-like protein